MSQDNGKKTQDDLWKSEVSPGGFAPGEVKNCSISFDEECDPRFGEKALWRAVITQALMDAGSQSKKKEMQYDRAKALSWLSGRSEDFNTVCQLAGLDTEFVRKSAHDAIVRGCTWRKDTRLKEQSKKRMSSKITTKIEINTKSESAQVITLAI